ncbi:uncharacterized protein V1516DRAFT_681659 [Lipomyces oligophaga]|uniref:uncharacterized protein n=1 Tax=Lipomyces oligophaga TaxID=45792 RepID=UPI0034CFF39C
MRNVIVVMTDAINWLNKVICGLFGWVNIRTETFQAENQLCADIQLESQSPIDHADPELLRRKLEDYINSHGDNSQYYEDSDSDYESLNNGTSDNEQEQEQEDVDDEKSRGRTLLRMGSFRRANSGPARRRDDSESIFLDCASSFSNWCNEQRVIRATLREGALNNLDTRCDFERDSAILVDDADAKDILYCSLPLSETVNSSIHHLLEND